VIATGYNPGARLIPTQSLSSKSVKRFVEGEENFDVRIIFQQCPTGLKRDAGT
jgi:hypothetical protein